MNSSGRTLRATNEHASKLNLLQKYEFHGVLPVDVEIDESGDVVATIWALAGVVYCGDGVWELMYDKIPSELLSKSERYVDVKSICISESIMSAAIQRYHLGDHRMIYFDVGGRMNNSTGVPTCAAGAGPSAVETPGVPTGSWLGNGPEFEQLWRKCQQLGINCVVNAFRIASSLLHLPLVQDMPQALLDQLYVSANEKCNVSKIVKLINDFVDPATNRNSLNLRICGCSATIAENFDFLQLIDQADVAVAQCDQHCVALDLKNGHVLETDPRFSEPIPLCFEGLAEAKISHINKVWLLYDVLYVHKGQGMSAKARRRLAEKKRELPEGGH